MTANAKTQNASLEGVRGAAALLVVLYHAGARVPSAIGNSYLAVDLFFVLSGFVICGAYGALSNSAGLRTFVIRRFGRLWPVHIAAALLWTATVNLSHIVETGTSLGVPSLNHTVAILTFTQGLNLFPYLIGTKVAWSAGDEFYVCVVFGLLCLTLHGRARVAGFAALAAAGYVIAVWASVAGEDCLHRGSCLSLTYSYGWARALAGFFLGAIVAECKDMPALRGVTRRVPQCLAALAVSLLLSLAGYAYSLALAAPLVFTVFVASLRTDCGPVARFFHERSFQYLGKISYSLYLGHAVLGPFYIVEMDTAGLGLIGRGVCLALFLAASIALAHLLNRFVEVPFRERFRAWSVTDVDRMSYIHRPN
ncbi:acyltransferase family protein [Trinickia sp. EG282A]|uniref:acyltransferase family protein n=1 Tax=Trinickia sp. EG282A TaxID=3237013 RepID=UPI0034D18229